MTRLKDFYFTHKPLIGFLSLVLGVIVALVLVISGNEKAARRDEHTRNTVCLILQQSDASIYAEEKSHQLGHKQAVEGLGLTAVIRSNLGPAPACTSKITPPNAKPPFHIAPVAKLPAKEGKTK